MDRIDPQSYKSELPAFKEKIEAFSRGEIKKGEYKGFSGYYGSYAQKGGEKNMLRLRMTTGRVTKEKLNFICESIDKFNIQRGHFTTCQAFQFHDLDPEAVCTIMEDAIDAGIITIGGGGDFPRNVMCSPLSGVEKGEYFNVRPYGEAAAEYAMNILKWDKMPRKLKICFSNSPKNVPHATYRDLGFVATPEGKFDVYSAGGLGNNAKFGVKVAEGIDPSDILYYIRAMYLTFCKYGNYQNRGKARTRYMQDICGGQEEYKKAYQEVLAEVLNSGEDLKITVDPQDVTKTGDGGTAEGRRIIEQKQEGLYAVEYHPLGGQPSLDTLKKINEYIKDKEAVEMVLSPDETSYIINLNSAEAKAIEAMTEDGAQTVFEKSVSCIGASTCQVGLRDSQALLQACITAVREAGIKDGALPQIHISGCPSSCGTHQTGLIGFRGHSKRIDKKPVSAFMLFVNGCDEQGKETMGEELGAIAETEVPKFLVELGKKVEESGLSYEEWIKDHLDTFKEIAAPYVA